MDRPDAIFIRTKDSGTRAMINANIGLGAHDWIGGDTGATTAKPGGYGSGDVFNAVKMSNAPDKTHRHPRRGLLRRQRQHDSTAVALARDGARLPRLQAALRLLARLDESSRDRRNVRDGRYGIWGYVHMVAADHGSTITNPVAKYFIDLVRATWPARRRA